MSWLAEARLGAGDLDRARALAEEGVAIAARIGARVDAIYAHWTLARVLLRDGADQADAIRAALREARRLIEETGAKNILPLVLLEQAELARLEGDPTERERALREASRLFSETGAKPRAEEVASHLDSLPG